MKQNLKIIIYINSRFLTGSKFVVLRGNYQCNLLSYWMLEFNVARGSTWMVGLLMTTGCYSDLATVHPVFRLKSCTVICTLDTVCLFHSTNSLNLPAPSHSFLSKKIDKHLLSPKYTHTIWMKTKKPKIYKLVEDLSGHGVQFQD